MKSKRPAGQALRRTVDQDGVVRVELRQGAPLRWILLGGLAVIAALVALGFALWPAPAAPPSSGGDQRAAGGEPQAKAAGRREFRMQWTKRAEPDAEPVEEPDPDGEPAPEEPDAPEEPERVGIAGMPLHGTKRIKVGIIVPEDFELPPGYVRHYQTTDRGRMLEAILMFHPDYEPVDAQGNPIPMPEDRVVPPELAPPGLPTEMLKVPEDAYTEPGESEEPPEGHKDPEDEEADPAP